jgi:hypothetical protein
MGPNRVHGELMAGSPRDAPRTGPFGMVQADVCPAGSLMGAVHVRENPCAIGANQGQIRGWPRSHPSLEQGSWGARRGDGAHCVEIQVCEATRTVNFRMHWSLWATSMRPPLTGGPPRRLGFRAHPGSRDRVRTHTVDPPVGHALPRGAPTR